MKSILYLLFAGIISGEAAPKQIKQKTETAIIYELFRLRNEHKADSAEFYFADTVLHYMKYLKNIPKRKITQSDKSFWKSHPGNKFEMTSPVQVVTKAGITTAFVLGKEYLDGTSFQYERIEIKFDRNLKINSFRGYKVKNVR